MYSVVCVCREMHVYAVCICRDCVYSNVNIKECVCVYVEEWYVYSFYVYVVYVEECL